MRNALPGKQALPKINLSQLADGRLCVVLSGEWSLRVLAANQVVQANLRQFSKNTLAGWDLRSIAVLDSSTALIIWRAWGEKWPTEVFVTPEQKLLFERWQAYIVPPSQPVLGFWGAVRQSLSAITDSFYSQILSVLVLLGQLVLDVLYLLSHPKAIPWSEISIVIYESGVRALGITALVGFLIGIVLSYLSALQLKLFGAEVYIINILGLSIIRELGPLLAAILVAGRSGSAMTAQIGIMRVTEELDALSAMGIAHSLRLVLPKVMALSVVMPLLGIWTCGSALLGGMASAFVTLDIGVAQFFLKLPEVVPLVNVFIGIGKSVVFGWVIALLACHFGFRIKPNTESLGLETTNSVVASITSVIMIDAVFAILLMKVGMP